MTDRQASLFSCCGLNSRTFPNINFQSSPSTSYYRILVPLKIRFDQGLGNFRGFYLKNALFRYVCSLMMTLHYRNAAARCNNRSFVASEPWFLVTCRRRYRPEILPGLFPIMSTALRAITLGLDPSVGTGSNPGDHSTVSQLALQPSKTKGKVQSKNCLFRDENCRT
jgi:hypothetical protein